MMNEQYIQKAEFTPKVCVYWLANVALLLTISVLGIPLLILWFPIGFAVTKRYLDRMECLLTPKALKVKKGIFIRVEKTIPLEKITDMGMVQGPIMRFFDVHTLTVETAGQSGVGSLVSLTGIVDAKAFREAVLSQREMNLATTPQTPHEATTALSAPDSLLTEIRDSLVRIESILKKNDDR